MPVITASLFARFASRQDDSPTMKVVAALRNQFGGHAVHAVRRRRRPRSPHERRAERVRPAPAAARLPQLGAGRPGAAARGRRCSSAATARARPTWSRRSATWPRWAATGCPPTRRWSGTATAQAVVRAALRRGDRELLVEVEINPGRANRARINRAPLPRPREMLGVVRTVLFAPEDLALVRGDPTERRRFLDELLVTRTPRLAGVRADYDRVLKQRNALLKTARLARGKRDSRPSTSGTGTWSTSAASCSRPGCAGRRPGAAHGRAPTPTSPGPAPPSPAWATRATVPLAGDGAALAAGAPLPTAAELTAALRERVAERRNDELDRGMTLVGPHRDDLVMHLGPAPAKGFASHGESWSLALALKLATFAPACGPTARTPSWSWTTSSPPWTPTAGPRWPSVARSAEQTLITAAVLDDVPAELRAACRASRSGEGIAVVVTTETVDGRDCEEEPAVSDERPARPSDIARAALEAARAAVGRPPAAHPPPDRRAAAEVDRRRPGRRRPAAARPAGGLPGHRAGLVGADPGRCGLRPLGGAGRRRHRRALRARRP